MAFYDKYKAFNDTIMRGLNSLSDRANPFDRDFQNRYAPVVRQAVNRYAPQAQQIVRQAPQLMRQAWNQQPQVVRNVGNVVNTVINPVPKIKIFQNPQPLQNAVQGYEPKSPVLKPLYNYTIGGMIGDVSAEGRMKRLNEMREGDAIQKKVSNPKALTLKGFFTEPAYIKDGLSDNEKNILARETKRQNTERLNAVIGMTEPIRNVGLSKKAISTIAKTTNKEAIQKLAGIADDKILKKLVKESDPKKVVNIIKSAPKNVLSPKALSKNIQPESIQTPLPKTAYNVVKNSSANPSLSSPDNIIPDFNSNSYIRELSKAQKVASKGDSFLDKVQGFKNDVKLKFVDRFSEIEDTLTKAEKEGKLSILPTKDIRMQLDRVLRSDSIATQFIKDRGLAKVIQDVPDIKAFDQYLIAKQAQDVAANGIETGRNLIKDRNLIQQLAPQYEGFAQQAHKFNRDVLDELVSSGMINKSLRDELIKKYPNYVPLNRVFSEIERQSMGGFGKSGSVASVGTQKVVKKLQGSTREIENPIESMISKAGQAIEQAEKNKAAQMLASYKDLPGNPFGIYPAKGATGNNTISVFVDGKKQIFEIDPDFAKAAKDMSRQQIGFLGQIFAVPTRLLKLGATGLNIPFVASNVVKDQVFATINSNKALKTSLANPDNFVRSMYSALKQDKLYDDWVRSGASFTSYDISRNQLKPTVSKIRSQKNVGTKVLHTITHPQDLLRATEDIIGKSEELTRIQQFNGIKQALIKEGRTVEDATILAAKAARENTANFARGGEWTVPLNAAIPYINAGIQGARSLTRNLATRPGQTSAKIAALVFTPIAFATTWNMADPQRKEAYDDIAEFEKENNIIIMPPNPVKDENGRWNAIKIPLTPGLSNLGSVVRRQIEGVNSIGKTATDALAALTSMDVSTPSKVLNQVTPQAIKPFIEGYTNTNLFTGRNIVPEYMKDFTPETQVKENTSGTARTLGKLFNTSPLKVENTIRTTMGGVGQQILNASDSALYAMGKIPKEQVGGRGVGEQIANRFTSATGGQKLNDIFSGKTQDNQQVKDNAGKIWMNVEGKPKSFKTQTDADISIAKTQTEKDGKKREIGDMVVYKSGDKVKSQNKYEYNDDLYYQQMNAQKKSGDIKNWILTGEKKLANLEKLLQQKDLDELDRIKMENRYTTLQQQLSKYKGYGGFTKGKGVNTKKRRSVKLKTKSRRTGKAITVNVTPGKIATRNTASPIKISTATPKSPLSVALKGGKSGRRTKIKLRSRRA